MNSNIILRIPQRIRNIDFDKFDTKLYHRLHHLFLFIVLQDLQARTLQVCCDLSAYISAVTCRGRHII